MEALQEELGATHESGQPKYTPAMKCDIVCAVWPDASRQGQCVRSLKGRPVKG
jgi:hypothetical protein